ncbi:MAG: sugar transferase [Thermoleophilia bacterium]|nr:sugar transferase [Gaiellaceae bacterium]MDW8339122.1 sugar transferase [Thermoleophilia bacterium]
MSVVSERAETARQANLRELVGVGQRRVGSRRGWLLRRLLLVADLLGLGVAFIAAMLLAPPIPGVDAVGSGWELVLFVASLPLWVVLFRLHGLYDRDEERSDHSTVDDVVGVFQVATLGTWFFLVLATLLEAPHPPLGRLVVFWLLAVALVSLLRMVARSVARRTPWYTQHVAIVGSGRVARLLATKILKHPEYGLDVVGFVDHDGGAVVGGVGPLSLLGSTDDLPELVEAHAIDRVIIAFSTDSHERTLDVIRALQHVDVQIDIVPRMFEVLGAGAQLHTVEGLPLIGLAPPRLSRSSRFLKRTLDLVGASLGLVLLSPLFLAVALAITLDTRGPIFFRQVRMGERGRPFRIFKFRTMVVDADERKAEVAHLNMHANGDPRMFKVPNDPRVTRVGAYLRRWRIDELPQLLNVLRGEMSLVGPRPLIPEEDRHVERWARRRLDLKPGMTGLWQVLGASDIPFDEMTKLDYLYVTNWSLREDLRLILLTLPAIVRARAAY